MSETVADIKEQVEQTQKDANALFVFMEDHMLTYVKEHKPVATGIVLALIDLLVVWAQAVHAPRADILAAIGTVWEHIGGEPNVRINSIREMDKHVN